MEKFVTEKNMDLEFVCTKMEEFTKDNGVMISKRVLEPKNFLMEAFLKGNTYMVNRMELVHIFGETDKDMMDNGSMVLSMVLECGEDKKEIHIKENGNMGNLMAMVYILGQMETHMKDNSKIAWNTDKAFKDLRTEIFTKVTI